MAQWQYDTEKEGLATVFFDYEIEALRLLWSKKGEYLSSRQVWQHLNEKLKISRASIINSLNRMARAGILDEDAFRTVKKEKKLRLLNDVYEKDAEGPKSITDLADIMMPHLGASTFEANENAARRAASARRNRPCWPCARSWPTTSRELARRRREVCN